MKPPFCKTRFGPSLAKPTKRFVSPILVTVSQYAPKKLKEKDTF